MAIASASSFVEVLRGSGLLERAQLDELARDLLPRFTDPKVLARELLQRSWLTPYQLNQLFQGNAQRLVLGPYILLERLGEGGMGQVFKARHRLMDRVVALKVIRHDHLAKTNAVGRFLREIKAAAQLSHPNIVTAHDADQVGDLHFMVMEYVDGSDLARMVKQGGPLPCEQACAFIRQAALGLQHAHERGMVHRDIKPANLLINHQQGQVKVLDMGLAKLFQTLKEDEAAGGLTQPESVVGTPDYISPEQAMNSQKVDIRGDLYSLGCTLYFALTGQVPFPGVSMTEKLLKHQLEQPAPVEKLRRDVPPGVAALVRKLMAKRPEERFQTPAELAAALEPFTKTGTAGPAIRAGVPTAAMIHLPGRNTGMPQATEEAARPSALKTWGQYAIDWTVWLVQKGREHPRVAAAIGGVFLVWIAYLYLRSTRPPLDKMDRSDIAAAERFTWQPEEVVGVIGEHSQRHARSVQAIAYSGDGRLLATACNQDPIVYLWDAQTRQQRATLKGHGHGVTTLAFAPDSRTLASGSSDQTIRIWDLSTLNEITTLHGHNNEINSLAFTSDGKLLGSTAWDGTVRLWDVPAAYKPAHVFKVQGAPSGVAFTHDGRTLAAGVSTNAATLVQLWDVPSRKELHSFPGTADGKGRIQSVAISVDGKSLAIGHTSRTVKLIDLASGVERATLQGFGAYNLAFSPDSKTLAVGGHTPTGGGNPPGEIKLYDAVTGDEKAVLKGEMRTITCVAYSPDGRTLASGSSDGGLALWDVASGKERPPLQGQTYGARSVAFSADGRLLAIGGSDGSVKLWDLAKRRDRIATKVHQNAVQAVAFSADGQLLASGGLDGSVRLWDVETGQIRDTIHGFGRGISFLAFTPDGKGLAIGGGNGLIVRELGGAREPLRLPPGEIGTAAITPDGKTIVTNYGNELTLWELPTGKQKSTFKTSGGIYALAFRPDGKVLAAGIYDRDAGFLVRLFDAAGKELHTLKGHQGYHRGLAFFKDGRHLLSCCTNGQLILWDAQTGDKRKEWKIAGDMQGLALAPDNRHVATANGNGTVYIFRIDPR